MMDAGCNLWKLSFVVLCISCGLYSWLVTFMNVFLHLKCFFDTVLVNACTPKKELQDEAITTPFKINVP